MVVYPGHPDGDERAVVRLTASWTDLKSVQPYLGFIEYPGGDGTYLEIN